jgi:hypothetical protein
MISPQSLISGSTAQQQVEFREVRAAPHASRSERAVDQILAESFPASDPPPWTPGMARPTPTAASSSTTLVNEGTRSSGLRGEGVIRESTVSALLRDAVGSLVGGVGITLLFTLAILMIGLPVALTVRAVVEVVTWLVARH